MRPRLLKAAEHHYVAVVVTSASNCQLLAVWRPVVGGNETGVGVEVGKLHVFAARERKEIKVLHTGSRIADQRQAFAVRCRGFGFRPALDWPTEMAAIDESCTPRAVPSEVPLEDS